MPPDAVPSIVVDSWDTEPHPVRTVFKTEIVCQACRYAKRSGECDGFRPCIPCEERDVGGDCSYDTNASPVKSFHSLSHSYRTHDEAIDYPCPNCNITFLEPWEYSYHMCTMHPSPEPTNDGHSVDSEKESSCGSLLETEFESLKRNIARYPPKGSIPGLLHASPLPGVLKPIHEHYTGRWSNVWTGDWTPSPGANPVKVAIKYLRALRISPDSEEVKGVRLEQRLYREVRAWQDAKHAYVLPLKGFLVTPEPCLVSPWCEKGNITEYIKNNPKANRLRLVTQIAEGLLYLHSMKPALVHGDVKPANILIDDQEQAIICDFGLARLVENVASGLTTSNFASGGTLRFMAPELFLNAQRTTCSDVYSLGFVILEVFTGKVPYYNLTIEAAVVLAVIDGQKPNRKDYRELKDNRIWELIGPTWVKDPMNRPPISHIARRLREIHQINQPQEEEINNGLLPNERGETRKRTRHSLANASMAELLEAEPEEIPKSLKKEGSDWYAIFHPDVDRCADIHLVASFRHHGIVSAVMLSPDGQLVATACESVVYIYDISSGKLTCELSHPYSTQKNRIRCLSFSPDGRLLATAEEGGPARLWKVGESELVLSYDDIGTAVYSLVFSPDGRSIFMALGDRTVRMCDVNSGEIERTFYHAQSFDGDDEFISCVDVSPDGSLLASANDAREISIWDVASGELTEKLRGHQSFIHDIAFSPDSLGLVSGGLDQQLLFWDLAPFKQNGQMKTPIDPGLELNENDPPSPPSELTSPGGRKGTTLMARSTSHSSYILSVCTVMNEAGDLWALSASKDRRVFVWDLGKPEPQIVINGHTSAVLSVDMHEGRRLIVTGGADWNARIWSY